MIHTIANLLIYIPTIFFGIMVAIPLFIGLGALLRFRETQIFVIVLLLMWLAGMSLARGHDMERPELNQWYENLLQPDQQPGGSARCCGEADAYWADEVRVRDGKVYAVVTDDRKIPGRTPIPVGTEFEIKDNKNNKDANPTGHSILFVSTGGFVYCYVQNGGS